MNKKTKQKLLIFWFLMMIMVIITAAGLPELILKAGMPLPEISKGNSPFVPSRQLQETAAAEGPLSGLIILFLALVLMLTTLFFASKFTGIKKASTFFLSALIICAAVGGIIVLVMLFFPASANRPVSELPSTPIKQDTRMPLGPVPAVLTWLLGISLAGFAVFLVVRLLILKNSPGEKNPEKRASYSLGLEAQVAKAAVLQGENYSDVITRCYRQMIVSLEQEKGIKREKSMTPEEFSLLLKTTGLPQASVHALTHLFEVVRYGDRQPSPPDEKKAIDCFETIIRFFKEAPGEKHHEKA